MISKSYLSLLSPSISRQLYTIDISSAIWHLLKGLEDLLNDVRMHQEEKNDQSRDSFVLNFIPMDLIFDLDELPCSKRQYEQKEGQYDNNQELQIENPCGGVNILGGLRILRTQVTTNKAVH